MIRNILNTGTFVLILSAFVFMSCNDKNDDHKASTDTTTVDTVYAKGADVSWLTEMEYKGNKFYNASGVQTDCIALLKSLGINSIRLRVWVNPTDGRCNKGDVLAKAWRAYKAGMHIMIDFHYSDTWADPSKQTTPTAWSNCTLAQLEDSVTAHTKDVLTSLKNYGITPEWVQVGNETDNGMLWPLGKASTSMSNYASLYMVGYNAVKAVCPNTKVIVHLSGGYNISKYTWIFNGLKSNGAKWDVIGMSVYPSYYTGYTNNKTAVCNTIVTDVVANIQTLYTTYNTPVMICEAGMPWDDASTAKTFLTNLITNTMALGDTKCLGIFYWEPECYGGWQSYTLGAFNDSGEPTEAMDAFK